MSPRINREVLGRQTLLAPSRPFAIVRIDGHPLLTPPLRRLQREAFPSAFMFSRSEGQQFALRATRLIECRGSPKYFRATVSRMLSKSRIPNFYPRPFRPGFFPNRYFEI